ncbi:hypothetical protein [Mycobacterium angelicum]|uniref:Uncharacterized protein n=1 Tax=Mycobacterium angelicum TaxID=470074 RepID=A0A1W9ZH50_MYCAN|nr:hypothetical protein [Mycobacterium angelicum]MCV7195647.1 hypothetical protein [Mycobacterium angelicum]ORA15157.1 hypothetical protein BST12_22265 [Mycobacterium angelicum]
MSPFGGGKICTERGQHIFVEELARFAAATDDLRVKAISERAAAPLRVSVQGRDGVGRATVARAVDAAPDIEVRSANRAEVVLYVTAEVVKPEDRDALRDIGAPVVVVLNKADLCGFAAGGPIAAAGARCARLSDLVARPVLPMIGLLAVAVLDEAAWAVLAGLAVHPAGAACLDGGYDSFLMARLPVPAQARLRLLETLDLFGIALGVAAVRRGVSRAQVAALLWRASGVDAVVAAVLAAGAEARYRRVLRAVAELEALAVSLPGIDAFSSCDNTVVARMADAADVLASSGLELGPAAPLQRAVRWQRYARGPVSDLHRACGTDIARGSLRLWPAAGETL